MKRIFFLSILIILALTSQAFALYNIMDQFAVEAVLNRPDITSNLDFMQHAENTITREEAVTYRSNFDNRIAVVLGEIHHDEFLNGLSIRLQMPIKENVTPHVHSVVKMNDVKIDDVGQGFLESLGYKVNVVGMGLIDDGPREEPGDRPVDDKPRPVHNLIGERVPEPSGEEVDIVVISDRDDAVDATPPKDVYILNPQTILLYKETLRWSIVQYETVDGNGVDFILNIMNAESISNEAREDFQQMIAFYGFDESALDLLDAKMEVMKSVELVPDADIDEGEFDFQSAMRTELEWLKANGIIMGITDQDIAGISEASKAGVAGWNSRIIYSEDSWRPYYDTDDPNLIRLLFEDASPPEVMETLEMPDGDVAFATASVTPGGKSITKWGKIKTGF